jgi:hypothetical protein
MNFDAAQASIISGFVAALVVVLRIAEKRLDRSRNGPLQPRVRQLEERFYDLDVKIADIERQDFIARIERVEAYIRQDIRNNADR